MKAEVSLTCLLFVVVFRKHWVKMEDTKPIFNNYRQQMGKTRILKMQFIERVGSTNGKKTSFVELCCDTF